MPILEELKRRASGISQSTHELSVAVVVSGPHIAIVPGDNGIGIFVVAKLLAGTKYFYVFGDITSGVTAQRYSRKEYIIVAVWVTNCSRVTLPGEKIAVQASTPFFPHKPYLTIYHWRESIEPVELEKELESFGR